jgi:hypothetical protein
MNRAKSMIKGLTAIIASGLCISSGGGNSHELCSGFLPPNDMKIPVGYKSNRFSTTATGGLTEAQFNEVLDRIEKLYSNDVTQRGGELKINRNWTDSTVNASAQQIDGVWILNMYGGLARHPEISIEGFALVACHELGHHLGGAPKTTGWQEDDWATNEGGADYYATLKCLRRYFSEDDNSSVATNSKVDPIATKTCMAQFSREDEQLLCMRNSLAGTSVAGLFMDLRKESKRPRFDSPDPKIVRKTFNNHPGTQCRMDTYLAGAVCPAELSAPLSDSDYHEGSCSAPNDTLGVRPRCWFAP